MSGGAAKEGAAGAPTPGRPRAALGFADALDGLDPAAWAPAAPIPARPTLAATTEAARAAGFRSREPREAPPAGLDPLAAVGPPPPEAPPRRRRTGRSMQLNLKARPETIAAYCALADRMGWGLGETLERAVALLEREHGG